MFKKSHAVQSHATDWTGSLDSDVIVSDINSKCHVLNEAFDVQIFAPYISSLKRCPNHLIWTPFLPKFSGTRLPSTS